MLCLTCSCFVMIGPKKRLPIRHKISKFRENREGIMKMVSLSARLQKDETNWKTPSVHNIMRLWSQLASLVGGKDANLLSPPNNCFIGIFLMEWKVKGSISTFAIKSSDCLLTMQHFYGGSLLLRNLDAEDVDSLTLSPQQSSLRMYRNHNFTKHFLRTRGCRPQLHYLRRKKNCY